MFSKQLVLFFVIAALGILVGVIIGGGDDSLLPIKEGVSTITYDVSSETVPSANADSQVEMVGSKKNEKPPMVFDDEVNEPEDAFEYDLDGFAIESMRLAKEEGDPRAPSLTESFERDLPTQEELDDYESYEDYEQRQNRKTYRAYVIAAKEKEKFLEEMIAKARQDGLPEEQIKEGEEKLLRIKAMREELLSQHPDLLELSQP